jgi:hypothetical protein
MTRDLEGDRVKYTFDWGDGTTSLTSFMSSGNTAQASHCRKNGGKPG